ncbi:uncharacterized protein LOC118550424 isoform X1 [Halichoerus grypus]
MMWTWASETEWTRLEWPEKALYTDVTLKNCGNAMALRFSVYKTEVTSHLESGEALCIWVGQRTIARNFSPSLCRSWPRSPHPLQRKVLRPGHGGHGGCSPSPWVWCSARPFVPPSHSLCYQHTRPSLSAGSRPRPSPLPSLTATAWEDEGRTPAFSLRCFCSQKLLSPEKPQEVLEEKIFQVWRVREEVPWEVTTSCLAENLLERGLRCPVPAAHRNCAHQQSDRGKEREEAPRNRNVPGHRCAHARAHSRSRCGQLWSRAPSTAADGRPVAVSGVAKPLAPAPSFPHRARSLLSAEGGEKAPGVSRSGCSSVLHNRKSSVNVMSVEEPSKTTRHFLLFFAMGGSICVSVRSAERPFLRRLLLFVADVGRPLGGIPTLLIVRDSTSGRGLDGEGGGQKGGQQSPRPSSA